MPTQPLDDATIESLHAAARHGAERAYAPYSNFHVGAAILDNLGRIHEGCNVENASYGLTNCAERTAMFRAVCDGATGLRAVAVYTPTETLTSPCGACRQVLAEFGTAETPVFLFNKHGQSRRTSVGELLPDAFNLKASQG